MTYDLSKLSPEELAGLKAQVQEQMKSKDNTFVTSILNRSKDKGDEVVQSQNGNAQIKHYINATNTEGFRIFGTVYIQNKKNPTALSELVE